MPCPIRPALALGAVAALAACQTETAQRPERAPPGQLPEVIRLAGEAGPTQAVAQRLQAEGYRVAIVATGRAGGIEATCSGAAEVLVIAEDLSNPERATCSGLGITWSAGTADAGEVLYVDYYWSENLFVETTTL